MRKLTKLTKVKLKTLDLDEIESSEDFRKEKFFRKYK